MSVLGGLTGALRGVANGDPIGGAVHDAADSLAGVGLNAIGSWVLDGTKSALQAVAGIIGTATAPNLESTWFSATYWRVAALAAMLTLPFLFAAAVQALLRSDLALLTRAAFGYLPLSLVGVSLAAPVTMLLLAATDQMSAAVAAAGTTGGARFLDRAAVVAGAYSAVDGSPFFAVVIGLCAVMAALALALELLVREAAVYVVVLMLPLAFAAMVWPARRIWAIRVVELLISLILSKFVIVAVLSLAGAAFAQGTPGVSQLLVAMALVMLSVFAPWTLLRILPFAELAAGAAGAMRRDLPLVPESGHGLAGSALGLADAAITFPDRLRRQSPGADSAGADGFADDRISPARAGADEPDRSTSTSPPTSPPQTPAGTPPQTPAAAADDPRPPMDRRLTAATGSWRTLELGPDFVRDGIQYGPPQEAPPAPDSRETPGPSPAARNYDDPSPAAAGNYDDPSPAAAGNYDGPSPYPSDAPGDADEL